MDNKKIAPEEGKEQEGSASGASVVASRQESEPAFPCPASHSIHGEQLGGAVPGMSLRDYFAAQALQGMLANNDCEFWEVDAKFAKWAYCHADAMLTARKAGAA